MKLQQKTSSTFFDFLGSNFFVGWAWNFSKCPNPPKPSKSRLSRKTRVKPPNVVRVRKLRSPNEQKTPRKLTAGAELRPEQVFVGRAPKRQNRSPTDATAPSPPPNGHLPGPRDAWDPNQSSVDPHLASDQNWLAGVASTTAPKIGNIHFLVFLACFGQRTGRRNFSKSPRHPKTSKSRIAAAGGRTIANEIQ